MILLVNDDGIQAQGLRTLYKALRERCNVPVLALAPSTQHSGQSHAITLNRGLNVSPVHEDDFFGFTIDGTPCDCVKLGLKILCQEKPNLVISGINRGPNVGRSIFYSGTVGAAIEAAIEGFAAIAVSQDIGNDYYNDAASFTADVAHACLRRKELQGHVLNINIPATEASQWKPLSFVEHGLSGFDETYKPIHDASDRTSWHLTGTRVEHHWEQGSDAHALRDGHPCMSMLRPNFNVDGNKSPQSLIKRIQSVSKRWQQHALEDSNE